MTFLCLSVRYLGLLYTVARYGDFQGPDYSWLDAYDIMQHRPRKNQIRVGEIITNPPLPEATVSTVLHGIHRA
ncbi:uncharacterized protein EDB91DRAFT_817890 [Suillus paluster]|uniref:uncharacterized protein n=1 Tax=Suillus paluster TaxID=48578 RepID=UPI001B87C937|nr:uncharacterized protein EDB91DRAFT_817890 [Suillus paluster]KAG1717521.1 hypothetical protein EDB91DRAFT_817890 [Suillus paluster]